jgi:hypothetical protein
MLLALTGCRAHPVAGAATPTDSATSPLPRPTITVTRSARVLTAGDTADFTAQAGVSLRLSASKPQVSRGRLSRSYGHPPARGDYVTFTHTIVNTGSQPVDLGPPNFHVRIPGEGVVTAYDGNAPYSGAPQQLDSTELDPGDRVRAPLTFDVRSTHGVLMYLPDRTAAVTWRF